MEEQIASSEVDEPSFISKIFNRSDYLLNASMNAADSSRLSMEKIISLNVFVLLVCASFIGNGLILGVIIKSKEFKRPLNYMIGNLVVSSVLQILAILSYYILKHLPLHLSPSLRILCHVFPVATRIPISVEVLSVMMIALDRFRVVKDPLDRETPLRAKKKIAFLWLISLLIELPLGCFWKFREVRVESNEFSCYNTKSLGTGTGLPWIIYKIIYLILVYVLPALILLKVLYSLTVILKTKLKTPCKTYLKIIDSHDLLGINAARKREAVRNSMLFIGIFIGTKLPTGIWWTLHDVPPEILSGKIRNFVAFAKPFFLFFFVCHFALYPFLIFFLSSDIRHYYWKRICSKTKPSPLPSVYYY